MLQPALQAVNGLLQEPGSIDLVTREAVKQVMEVKLVRICIDPVEL
jgi:hypothetical protein